MPFAPPSLSSWSPFRSPPAVRRDAGAGRVARRGPGLCRGDAVAVGWLALAVAPPLGPPKRLVPHDDPELETLLPDKVDRALR